MALFDNLPEFDLGISLCWVFFKIQNEPKGMKINTWKNISFNDQEIVGTAPLTT